jgi:hypothetical protein
VWSIKVDAIVLPLTKFANSVTFSPANRSHSHAPLEPLRTGLRVLDDGMKKDDGMKQN